ncbi:MAG: aspartyl/glutamyl-tRNA amidotransferase subunit C [Armatimonadetes bacterium]|nr:aspartyl/glutamyl-tRNA amidotransferase subunit C [Armatimonadota bacterium]
MRDDEVGESLSRGEVLSNAPQQRDGCFVVPRILAD